MLAIIGGSGLAGLTDLSDTRRRVVRTPYGDPSCALTFGRIGSTDIAFLARHGYGHTLAPHEINYRANIWALREVGVERIIAVATVGGIREDLGPGSDHPRPDHRLHPRAPATYFEGIDAAVVHADFTEPYDAGCAGCCWKRQGVPASPRRVLRLHSGPAPRNRRRGSAGWLCDGCDLVGMTGMPEVAAGARACLRYACIAVVANHAAGLGSSREQISMEAIRAVLDTAIGRVHGISSAVRC
ncbi:MAG: S-methyl-5'-thioinosine phosphorylase [Paracoccaceae bacterium]